MRKTMRLIDADALCRLAQNSKDRTVDCNDIMRMQTVDAVQVVRCNDCKWWEQSDEYGWCQILTLDGETRPDWFCADGERTHG